MIAVECYADTMLVNLLGVPKRKVRHVRNKGNVLHALRMEKALMGVIDEDPGAAQPRELQKYYEVESIGSLSLRQHKENKKIQVVVIAPRLEEWLLRRACACGINVADYGLKTDARKLHSSGRYDRHPKFKTFIGDLLDKDKEFKQLNIWLTQAAR